MAWNRVEGKLNGFTDAGSPGFGDIQLVAAVVVGRVANVPSFFTMEVPRLAIGRAFMNESATTKWDKRAFVVVKGAIDVFFC